MFVILCRGKLYPRYGYGLGDEVIAGEKRGCILRIGHRNVDKDGKENDVDGSAVDDKNYSSDNPMDMRVSGPS